MGRPEPLPTTPGGWLLRAEGLYLRSGAALGQISTEARDDALYLILRTLGLPLDSEAAVLKRPLTRAQSASLEEAFRRRIEERIPAAYLTHEAWLGGLRFHVDERVLIPRSYFVEMFAGGFDRWLPKPSAVQRVADVCTGSGCLAVLLARHFQRARVDAVDLSADALAVAAINVRRFRLGGRIRLFQSDVFDAVTPDTYDLILSNPPYEPTARVDALAREFKREPRMALDGGGDGMAVIRKLIAQAGPRLKPEGVLMIEVGGLRKQMDREYSALEPIWLPTEDGSDCLCALRAARLNPSSNRTRRTRPAGLEMPGSGSASRRAGARGARSGSGARGKSPQNRRS